MRLTDWFCQKLGWFCPKKIKVTGSAMPTNVKKGDPIELIARFTDGSGNIVAPSSASSTISYLSSGVATVATVAMTRQTDVWTGTWDTDGADLGLANWAVASSLTPTASPVGQFRVISQDQPTPPDPEARTTYGMWDYSRIGSMATGSNILTLTAPSAFRIGDPIIVQIGGEAGQGLYQPTGSVGVGGVYTAGAFPQDYYFAYDAPKALATTITGVSADGMTLTLASPAVTATTGATVYFDNYPIVNALFAESHPAGWLINFAYGSFAMSNCVFPQHLNGWTTQGQGKTNTILFAPRGAMACGFRPQICMSMTWKNFAIHGNFGDNYFGYESGLPAGIWSYSSIGDTVSNMSFSNLWLKAVWFEFSRNCTVTDCDYTQIDPHRSYFAQWFFGASDSDNVVCTRCTFNSPQWLNAGYEMFRSSNCQFVDCTSTNGAFSSNSSGSFIYRGITLTTTALSRFSDASFFYLNPLININSNIQPPSPAMLLGGTISGINITVQGYMDTTNRLPGGININIDNPNITVDGTLINYLVGWHAGAGAQGAVAVNSTGQNTIVKNLTCTGTTEPNGSFKNINVQFGAVTNCTAPEINCVGPNCILTP